MNSPRFDRFSQPRFLQRIGRERVTQMLLPFAPELLAHGMALPAARLPDDLFFKLLTTLPRFQGELSAGLLEAMTAIEVIEDVFPDERPAAPLEVMELRLRLRTNGRAILLKPAANHGLVDNGMSGLVEGTKVEDGGLRMEEAAVPYFVVVVDAEPRLGNGPAGSQDDGLRDKAGASAIPGSPASGVCGRLRWENGFNDVWLGETHYDLRTRNSARFCIQYLVESQAFDKSTARHLETEIDPFVRIKTRLPALPKGATSNLRIQRYFNDPVKKYQQLRKELIRAEGRTGRFYLQVN